MSAPAKAAAPPIPEKCRFVLFGVTGDLAHRLVVPALYNLAEAGLLPEDFCVVGVTRSDSAGAALRGDLEASLATFANRPLDPAAVGRLLGCFSTVSADPGEPESFERLKQHLADRDGGTPGDHVYYLAVPPNGFEPICAALGAAGLLAERAGAWRRVVIEKPFGTDLASARALNHALLALMGEDQIFRIDHYLGKETVQNILVLRFANGLFEPIWNRHHIDHVQITVAEHLDVGRRGNFYDATGALRDMVPNHLFQLLSLVAMEPPARFDARSVRAEKAEILAAIQMQSSERAARSSVRGQYRAGRVGERDVGDYRTTQGVAPGSVTETYAALKLMIDNWRWAGVPFYLRTGKALGAKRTEVAIRFKPAPFSMFRDTAIDRLAPNDLVIAIGPEEGVTLQFNSKVPGPEVVTDGVEMSFRYGDYFKAAPSTGYETLLYDVMTGDNLLFQDATSIEAGWQAVQPFLDAWRQARGTGLTGYTAGTDGPAAADDLIARDGRAWRRLDQ